MVYVAKIAIALVVFTLVEKLSKDSPRWGGLISALPWITVLVVVTRHQFDSAPASDLVKYLWATFWFILPTLLFVAVLAGLLQRGTAFYVSLTASVAMAALANWAVAYWLEW
jgi:hypothetical protein